jgi:hypothetical protein
MTVDNLKTRKSVPPHESDQGQAGSVVSLVCDSTLLPDESSGTAIREVHLSEVSCSNPVSPPGKFELPSKPAPPTPPTIVWRTLMLEQ